MDSMSGLVLLVESSWVSCSQYCEDYSNGVCHLTSSVLKMCQACCVPACASDRDEMESKFILIL